MSRTVSDEKDLSDAEAADRDALLVERVRASNDESAATKLIQLYEKKLFRTVLSLTTNRAEAQDICQIALLEALQKLNKLKDPRAFAPWLFRIARNRAIDALRSRKSSGQRDSRWLHDASLRQIEVDLGQSLDQSGRRKVVISKLNQLPGLYRAILVLYYWHDEPVRGISEQLDIPVGTVKAYLHRAREILRHTLDRQLIQ